MGTEREDIGWLTARIRMLEERVHQLEGQVQGLMMIQAIEAQEFILRDGRGEVRARLDIRDYAPRLTFYDRIGGEGLHIGLHADGTPDLPEIRGQAAQRQFARPRSAFSPCSEYSAGLCLCHGSLSAWTEGQGHPQAAWPDASGARHEGRPDPRVHHATGEWREDEPFL